MEGNSRDPLCPPTPAPCSKSSLGCCLCNSMIWLTCYCVMLEEVKKRQVFGCTLWSVLFCLVGFKDFTKLCVAANCFPGCFSQAASYFLGAYVWGIRRKWDWDWPLQWWAHKWGVRATEGSREIPWGSPQVVELSVHTGTPFCFPRRNDGICLTEMISFCLAALTHVNEVLRTSFSDILAQQVSEYGTVKPHFNSVSRHVSSLFINLKTLQFLIELLPCYCWHVSFPLSGQLEPNSNKTP